MTPNSSTYSIDSLPSVNSLGVHQTHGLTRSAVPPSVLPVGSNEHPLLPIVGLLSLPTPRVLPPSRSQTPPLPQLRLLQKQRGVISGALTVNFVDRNAPTSGPAE
jgi:hypothetical protein